MAAVESLNMKELKNAATETILLTISEIFTLLFKRYQRAEYDCLRQEKNKLETSTYYLANPPVIIYNAIKDLKN